MPSGRTKRPGPASSFRAFAGLRLLRVPDECQDRGLADVRVRIAQRLGERRHSPLGVRCGQGGGGTGADLPREVGLGSDGTCGQRRRAPRAGQRGESGATDQRVAVLGEAVEGGEHGVGAQRPEAAPTGVGPHGRAHRCNGLGVPRPPSPVPWPRSPGPRGNRRPPHGPVRRPRRRRPVPGQLRYGRRYQDRPVSGRRGRRRPVAEHAGRPGRRRGRRGRAARGPA